MRVGITVNFQHSFFSCGSPQTVLSVAEIFRDHDITLINVHNSETTWWEDISGLRAGFKQIHVSSPSAEPFDCVIEIGSMLLTPAQRKGLGATTTTSKGTKFIWLNRKAPLFHDIEASLFPFTGERNLEGIDEIWVYQELATTDDINYLELLTRKKVRAVPYAWTPTAVEFHRQETQAPVWQQVAQMEGMQALPWSIHICETNSSSSSNSTIPLLIMRQLRKGDAKEYDLNKSVKIHNADNIKATEFFRFNVLDHCFSDIDISGQFIGRQRVIDWVYDPKSIVIAHSRFVGMRPYHLDCLWVGIPLVHNSRELCRLGELVSKGFYSDNQISEAVVAFGRATQAWSVEQLIEVRKRILEEFSPISVRILKGWGDALTGLFAEASSAVADAPSEKVLKVGFSCMWDSFNPEYNMFTLMMEDAAKGFSTRTKIRGLAANPHSGEVPDILIFGPFGGEWKDFPKSVPKIHFTGENSPLIQQEDVVLNLGFKHLDMVDDRYLRLPLWMLEINWFRADAERIGNPKPLPIDACCKVHANPEKRDKFCAFVVTNPRQPMRNAAFHWLSKYKRVDSAGQLYNNIGDQIFAGLGGGGGELKKHEFLKKYKFCFAYENESSPGYMTEKWLHAKAAGCIPIYWGDPKAERDFDMSSCIDAREAVTPKMLIGLVSAVDNDPAKWEAMYNKPALDEVRRDLVRRTLSECARRLWLAAGASKEDLATIPRFIGYTTDTDYPPTSPTDVSMDKTIFVTACNEKFLSSLHILLNSLLAQQKEIEELKAIVYLMDVSKDVQQKFEGDFKFCEFRRLPSVEAMGVASSFPDIWDPQHFAWKVWILRAVCGEAAFAGRPILYMDSGVMMCRWPRDWLSEVRRSGICLIDDPTQINRSWCHEQFIEKMAVTEGELAANQLWAGAFSFIAGHPLAARLLEDSWAAAKIRDVIVGPKWSGVRDGKPYGHRHDQSIFSVLSARMRVPRIPIDSVYCDVSLRQTFLSKKSLYVHRSLFAVHTPVATGIDDAWVINLDRRADRMEKFKTAHPDLAGRAHRVSAFEAKHLSLTPNLVRLFQPHDFNWKKPVMGCALSHLAMWTQLLEDREEVDTYLIMEDDVKLAPNWRKSWEKIHKHNALPEDWDIVYLGGILPPNKEAFEKGMIEQVNEYVGRIKKNQFFGQSEPNRYMHFCAYAYVLSRRGAKKILEVLAAKGGYWTSADHMMCNIHDYLNIYFPTPLIAGCFQDDDPVYVNSAFNDFSRVDKFDSDLWNNTDRFTAEEVASCVRGDLPLDIRGALDDARRVCSANAEANASAQEAKEQKEVKGTPLTHVKGRRFVSLCMDTDMSDWHEFAWLKQLFSGISLEVERLSDDALPTDSPIVVVQRPHVDKIAQILMRWSSMGLSFYVLHLSDEFCSDRIDFYQLPGCKGVVRNYFRDDLYSAVQEKVAVIPLGFHWAIHDGQPMEHTPRPPFRELAWSFVGTGWCGRREKLEPLKAIHGEHRLALMDDWNSPKMLGREETLAILLNSWCVPCPAGNNGETFRVYEALEAGAVPVVVQEEGMELFFKFIGPKLPLLLANSWTHAAQLIYTLKAQPEMYEQYRGQILAAWEVCKKDARDSVKRVFDF